eukprot:TRINITY_DN1317_c0_g1_i1.p1 TRINITY_DN1317_c0_g1~~TRINITY_DN1317_c0_g1_i1.p1  ORF type:complete len:351 (-),score=61.94 TRINITY_DN1317_c0_g1_i1:23-1075(-)
MRIPEPENPPPVLSGEVTFHDLERLGLQRKAEGCTLRVQIMEKIMEHWPNSKQVRIIDSLGDPRSVFFYTDEPEPYFSMDDLREGNYLVFRDPHLHFFMDGQVGLRIEDATLVSIEKTSNFDTSRRAVFAKAEKEDGSLWYKDKKWDQALYRYDSALKHCDGTPTSDPELAALRRETQVACYLNIAACFTQQKKHEDVIKFCRKVIDLDPKQPKAFYRMGQAQVAGHSYEQAEQNFVKALALAPTDKAIQEALREVRAEIKALMEAERQLWKGKIQSQPSPESADRTSEPDAAADADDSGPVLAEDEPRGPKVISKGAAQGWNTWWFWLLAVLGGLTAAFAAAYVLFQQQ